MLPDACGAFATGRNVIAMKILMFVKSVQFDTQDVHFDKFLGFDDFPKNTKTKKFQHDM
jgi:hypothetical protein